jgi:hypothetical protein
MALPNSTLELNLNMGTASLGLPMVALLLVPANVSRVVSISVYSGEEMYLLVADGQPYPLP